MGPPVLGIAVPRLAKLNAINKDPAEVIIQAIIAVLGFDAAAKDAAEVKIPEPIQLPTTIALLQPDLIPSLILYCRNFSQLQYYS
jgi:hypothetical protein